MWHVSSRSGVATLRTAIHLLLTYQLSLILPLVTINQTHDKPLDDGSVKSRTTQIGMLFTRHVCLREAR